VVSIRPDNSLRTISKSSFRSLTFTTASAILNCIFWSFSVCFLSVIFLPIEIIPVGFPSKIIDDVFISNGIHSPLEFFNSTSVRRGSERPELLSIIFSSSFILSSCLEFSSTFFPDSPYRHSQKNQVRPC
jgi:hypothetical protein